MVSISSNFTNLKNQFEDFAENFESYITFEKVKKYIIYPYCVILATFQAYNALPYDGILKSTLKSRTAYNENFDPIKYNWKLGFDDWNITGKYIWGKALNKETWVEDRAVTAKRNSTPNVNFQTRIMNLL